ncbi:MAG: leucyl/phenylalanyl-tRNA--protein transferase [Proteobacteria bacterium]|nr:leucyl/phenylalanyl-tRNA--protein transferase [Pseudomonadota bacterium]MBU1715401.1 leucyl/phenylalanyl-tRNA--protein transferase [Pseudomonadota bacterium]
MPVFQLEETLLFPPPQLARDDGLLAVGGDLSVERLLLAYSQGIFPWYSPGEPILWWAPDPRLVLFPDELKVSKRLARSIRQNKFQTTFNRSFREVITACSEIRAAGREGTWIDQEMITAYCRLHDLGHAHSVESWQDDKLVGGLYGVSIGKIFFGESMFSRVTDSSKVALAALVNKLESWGFTCIDCQVNTPHLISLGAREIPGEEFYHLLAENNPASAFQQNRKMNKPHL